MNTNRSRIRPPKAKTYRLLGAKVNALCMSQLNALICDSIQNHQRCVIANHNLHSIYLYHHDAKMRDFYANADYTHIDGMILILLGKLFRLPLQRQHRVTYADWTPSLMAEAIRNQWRIFYLGSKPGVVLQGAEALRKQYPGLQLAIAHGYFDARPGSIENQKILDLICDYQPHVLMVGMSMPRQEHWILDNLDKIEANAILPAGAAIDYIAGAVPTPPRWAGRVGLEWLFRLFAEPQRLWQRYLVEPWFLLGWFLFKRRSFDP
ncbi:MAG: WecB/TagA/CpsF family glycosyltransferase [Leptolyngbya sp. Prado105]|jgi:N-acetylglucosaminyldiphosphoundecaprenol N-acetyl-beta-D-mannosaminyltransferase|nr:WecB/TagA/CpsF family glycosyltransferase [Leptolyngbya sp. Prado105]